MRRAQQPAREFEEPVRRANDGCLLRLLTLTPTSLIATRALRQRKIRSVHGGRQIKPGPGKAGCDMKQCARGNDAGFVRAYFPSELETYSRCVRTYVFETFGLRRWDRTLGTLNVSGFSQTFEFATLDKYDRLVERPTT